MDFDKAPPRHLEKGEEVRRDLDRSLAMLG
jgi:hypothetical protein